MIRILALVAVMDEKSACSRFVTLGSADANGSLHGIDASMANSCSDTLDMSSKMNWTMDEHCSASGIWEASRNSSWDYKIVKQ